MLPPPPLSVYQPPRSYLRLGTKQPPLLAHTKEKNAKGCSSHALCCMRPPLLSVTSSRHISGPAAAAAAAAAVHVLYRVPLLIRKDTHPSGVGQAFPTKAAYQWSVDAVHHILTAALQHTHTKTHHIPPPHKPYNTNGKVSLACMHLPRWAAAPVLQAPTRLHTPQVGEHPTHTRRVHTQHRQLLEDRPHGGTSQFTGMGACTHSLRGLRRQILQATARKQAQQQERVSKGASAPQKGR
jgi:hypothetical protein